MALVLFSEQIRRDLDGIVQYLERVAGAQVALDYALEFERSTNQLVDNPGLGAPRSKYGRNIRMLIVEPYLIFYDGGPKAKQVIVLRMLDGRRRISRRMIVEGRDKSS